MTTPTGTEAELVSLQAAVANYLANAPEAEADRLQALIDEYAAAPSPEQDNEGVGPV